MKQTVQNASQFRDAFRAMDRHTQFSYEGMGLLFDYLEECDPDMELDVVSICCEYAESTLSEIAEAYGIEIDENESENEQMQQVKDFLESATVMIGTTDAGSIVYQQF
jgi:hypothetical protein